MLSVGTDIFLRLPDESEERVLHPGRIVDHSESVHAAELEEPDIAPTAGQEALIYFERRREFMQQSARIDAVMQSEIGADLDIAHEPHDDPAADVHVADGQVHGGGEPPASDEPTGPRTVIGFELLGEPVSAESRQCYRVSTVISGLVADFGDDIDCPIVDASATGFAVIATARHAIGAILPAALQFEDRRYAGDATVKSIKELPGGRIRYGLHCLDEKGREGNLLAGARAINTGIQRQQLRRRTGTS